MTVTAEAPTLFLDWQMTHIVRATDPPRTFIFPFLANWAIVKPAIFKLL